jgi:hypothetical protein
MSLALVNVSWSAFNSLMFAETSAMSLSLAIFNPFSLEHLDTLLEADKDASDTFKNGFNGREIALDTIKGKSKNFNKLMN